VASHFVSTLPLFTAIEHFAVPFVSLALSVVQISGFSTNWSSVYQLSVSVVQVVMPVDEVYVALLTLSVLPLAVTDCHYWLMLVQPVMDCQLFISSYFRNQIQNLIIANNQ